MSRFVFGMTIVLVATIPPAQAGTPTGAMGYIRHWCATNHVKLPASLKTPSAVKDRCYQLKGLVFDPNKGHYAPKDGDLMIWPTHAAVVQAIVPTPDRQDVYTVLTKDSFLGNRAMKMFGGIQAWEIKDPTPKLDGLLGWLRPFSGTPRPFCYIAIAQFYDDAMNAAEIESVMAIVNNESSSTQSYVEIYHDNWAEGVGLPWLPPLSPEEIRSALQERMKVRRSISQADNALMTIRSNLETMDTTIKPRIYLFTSGSFADVVRLHHELAIFKSRGWQINVVPFGNNLNRAVIRNIATETNGKVIDRWRLNASRR